MSTMIPLAEVHQRERTAFEAGAHWALEQRQAPCDRRTFDLALKTTVEQNYPDPIEQDFKILERKYGEDAVHQALRRMGF